MLEAFDMLIQLYVMSQLTEAVTFLTSILEVPNSNLDQNLDFSDKVSHGFRQPLQTNVRIVPKLGHYHSHPHPLKFIITQSFSTVQSELLTASLSKLQIQINQL
jgi:hypothetical protein